MTYNRLFWLLEKIQCPLCRARGGDEATAKANCDKNARIATCPVGRTLCVDYFSPSKRYFRRGCTTPKLYNEFVRKCQQVGCRLKNCTHPRCVAGEGPGMNFFSSPSVPPSHPWTRWVKRQVHYAQLDPWKTRWDNKSICSRRWLPISELSLASFLKRVPVLILSYDYKFLFTYKLNLFSYEWLSTRPHLEIEPKGASEMADYQKGNNYRFIYV